MNEKLLYLTAINFWSGIFLLILFFYSMWQKAIVDLTRNKFFKIRDMIFLMAANGEIDFNSAEYNYIRDAINARISLCEKYTWITLYLLPLIYKNSLKKPIEKKAFSSLFEAVNSIQNEEVRNKLIYFVIEINLNIQNCIVLRSIFLPLIWPLTGLYTDFRSIKFNKAIEQDILIEKRIAYVP